MMTQENHHIVIWSDVPKEVDDEGEGDFVHPCSDAVFCRPHIRQT